MNNDALPRGLLNKNDPMLKPSWALSRCLLKILEDFGMRVTHPILQSVLNVQCFQYQTTSFGDRPSMLQNMSLLLQQATVTFKSFISLSLWLSLFLSDCMMSWCGIFEINITSEVEAIYPCRYLSYRSNVYIIYIFYPIYLTFDRSTYLCPSIFSIYLLIIDQSTYPSIYPNIYLSIYGIHWYIHLSHLISSHLISSHPILSYLILSYLSIYLSILALPTLHFLIYISIHPLRSPPKISCAGWVSSHQGQKHRDQMYVTSWWNLDDSWVQVVHHHQKYRKKPLDAAYLIASKELCSLQLHRFFSQADWYVFSPHPETHGRFLASVPWHGGSGNCSTQRNPGGGNKNGHA